MASVAFNEFDRQTLPSIIGLLKKLEEYSALIDVIVYAVLIGFYFCSDGSETSQQEALLAIGVYGIYLIIYLIVGPFPAATSKYMGQLYGFLPMLSFGAILYPHFNTNCPEVVTRAIGWVGLTTAFVIISYFKLFVW
ncbi:hypothetical protein [Photobacterium nomapromontoriensis]|uniref:hypothetical protein n=1 Tax=Photobacterium nomapromontoriensis TaxID=2910237 RepID=UPI003D0E2FA5